MTLDKNGAAIQGGDIVKIENAFFKHDNGYWFVTQAGPNEAYSGSGAWLTKIGKGGKISTAKYNLTSWPLCSYLNDREKNRAADAWNKNHATIEIVSNINNAQVIEFFQKEINDEKAYIEYYEMRGYPPTFTEGAKKKLKYNQSIIERLTKAS